MFNSEEKYRTLHDKRKTYSNSCVVRKKNSEQVKWSVPYIRMEITVLYLKISRHQLSI